jgi:hypothetical protein
MNNLDLPDGIDDFSFEETKRLALLWWKASSLSTSASSTTINQPAQEEAPSSLLSPLETNHE